MLINTNTEQVKEIIDKAKSLLVVTKENPSIDALVSLISIYRQFKEGKEVYLATRGPIPEAVKNLEGGEKISLEVAPRNLIISFDYVEGMIEKVSYNVEGNKFNLIISPKSGAISPEKVEYSYTGGKYDVIIVLDTQDLISLNTTLHLEQEELSEIPLINIDFHHENKNYGKLNLVDLEASSVSEVLINFFKQSKLEVKSEVADLLLYGLRSSTVNFTQKVSPQTFESAAWCLQVSRVEKEEKGPSSLEKISNEESEIESEEVKDESWLSPKIFRSSSSLD